MVQLRDRDHPERRKRRERRHSSRMEGKRRKWGDDDMWSSGESENGGADQAFPPSAPSDKPRSFDFFRSVLTRLKHLDTQKHFHQLVPRSEHLYYHVIENPVSFAQMSQKISRGKYSSLEEMKADFELIIENCTAFNAPESGIFREAMDLLEKGRVVFEEARYEENSISDPSWEQKLSKDESDADEAKDISSVGNLGDNVERESAPGTVLSDVERIIVLELVDGLVALDSVSGGLKLASMFDELKKEFPDGKGINLSAVEGVFERACSSVLHSSYLLPTVTEARVLQIQARGQMLISNARDEIAMCRLESSRTNEKMSRPATTLGGRAHAEKKRRINSVSNDGGERQGDEKTVSSASARMSASRHDDSMEKELPVLDDRMKLHLSLLVRRLAALDGRHYFDAPVPRSVPGYYDLITEPMCFREMKKKADNTLYRSIEDIRDDFALIVSNCKLFNEDSSAISVEVNKLDARSKEVFRDAEINMQYVIQAQKKGSQKGSEEDGKGTATILERDKSNAEATAGGMKIDSDPKIAPLSRDPQAQRTKSDAAVEQNLDEKESARIGESTTAPQRILDVEMDAAMMLRQAGVPIPPKPLDPEEVNGTIDEESLMYMNLVYQEVGLVGRDRFMARLRQRFPTHAIPRRLITQFIAIQRDILGLSVFETAPTDRPGGMMVLQPAGYVRRPSTEKPTLESVMDALLAMDEEQRFLHPVPTSTQGYYETVADPICFMEIKEKLGNGAYENFKDLESDFVLLVRNWMYFFEKGTDEYSAASTLYSKGADLFKETYAQEEKLETQKKEAEAKDRPDKWASQLTDLGRRAPVMSPLSPSFGVGNEHDVDYLIGFDIDSIIPSLINRLVALDENMIFYFPVLEQEAPNYYAIVKQPMCFQDMHNKMKNDKYQSIGAVEQDFRLLTLNCMEYCDSSSEHYKAALKLLRIGSKVIAAWKDAETSKRGELSERALLPSIVASRWPPLTVPPPRLPPLPPSKVEQEEGLLNGFRCHALSDTQDKLLSELIELSCVPGGENDGEVLQCFAEVNKRLLDELVREKQVVLDEDTEMNDDDYFDYDPSRVPGTYDDESLSQIRFYRSRDGPLSEEELESLSKLEELHDELKSNAMDAGEEVEEVQDARGERGTQLLLDRTHAIIAELYVYQKLRHNLTPGTAPSGKEVEKAHRLAQKLGEVLQDVRPMNFVEKSDSRLLLDDFGKTSADLLRPFEEQEMPELPTRSMIVKIPSSAFPGQHSPAPTSGSVSPAIPGAGAPFGSVSARAQGVPFSAVAASLALPRIFSPSPSHLGGMSPQGSMMPPHRPENVSRYRIINNENGS